MADKKTVKINTTESYDFGQVPGIADTLVAMEQFDMNKIDDSVGKHPEINGPATLGGRGKSGAK